MSNSKVALVIDCISNIGQAIVKSLAKKGYLVAIVGNHEELVCKIAQECAELSPVKFKVNILVKTYILIHIVVTSD